MIIDTENVDIIWYLSVLSNAFCIIQDWLIRLGLAQFFFFFFFLLLLSK